MSEDYRATGLIQSGSGQSIAGAEMREPGSATGVSGPLKRGSLGPGGG